MSIKLMQAVLLIQTFGAIAEEGVYQSHCTTRSHVITCNGFVPEFVPREVHSVEIVQLKDKKQEQFAAISEASWTHIEVLTIHCTLNEEQQEKLSVQNLTFKSFSNLKSLKISCPDLDSLSKEVFVGLDNLTVLDLSDCFSLSVVKVTAALDGNVLRSLQQLTLRRFSLYTSSVYFSKEFFYSLRNKPIRHLDLSGTKYGSMHMQAFAESLPKLAEFNVSEGGILTVNLLKSLYDYSEHFYNLRSIDISYTLPWNTVADPSNILTDSNTPSVKRPLRNITSIYAQGFMPNGLRSQFFGSNQGQVLCMITVIPQDKITLGTFCFLKYEDQQISLQRLNLAYNGIEYIDSSLASHSGNLRYLDLSHNYLNQINSLPTTSLSKHLVEFYITYNSLYHIPYDLFTNTKEIQVIDMSNNDIESVTFKLDHLYNLRVLRLDHNKIHTLDAQDRMTIIQLVHVRTKQNLNESSSEQSLIIYMRSNPFTCSCANKEFVELIFKTKQIQFSSVCSLRNDNSSIYHKVISKIDHLCKLPLIIGICSAGGSFLLIVGAIVCVLCFRRRRESNRKIHLMALIEKYKTNHAFTYPVFLSYSSADEDFINANVIEELNGRLQVLLDTNKTCVATGDTTFRPGFYVVEEVIKWIECSEVIILCVSKNFCKSPWCKDEIFVSKYQHKPIVLMFLEEVKTSEMPKVLLTYFSNTTRSKWLTEGNSVKLVPSWDTVCQSIVELMTPTSTDL